MTTTQEEVCTVTVTQAPSTVTQTTTQEEVCTITATETTTTTQEEVCTVTETQAPYTVTQTTTQEQAQTVYVTSIQEEEYTVTVGQQWTATVYVTVSTCATTPTSTWVTSTTASKTHSHKSSCPTDLSGSYQFPHLIVPVNSSSPNTAYGTQYFGTITPDVSSIFNFDIPSNYAGLQCSLIFLFPEQSQLQTSSYTFSGSGEISVELLSQVATQSTTYNSVPPIKSDLGNITVAPGNSYNIDTFPCPANSAISFELISESGTSLTYFQDYNPAPIGLYITSCSEPSGKPSKWNKGWNRF